MAKAKKLPSGNWRVRAKRNGEMRSFTAASKHEAEMAALQWQSGGKTSPSDLTVGEAMQKYLDAKRNVLAINTYRSYHMMMVNYYNTIIDERLCNLTDEAVQIAVDRLAATRSPKTVRNAYGFLTAVIGMFRRDFSPNVTLPPKEKRELVIPDRDDVKKLLDLARGTNLYIPVALAAFCGLREAEICALTPEDILGNKIHVSKSLTRDSASNAWIIKPPKTESGDRYVDMPPQLKREIEAKNGAIPAYTPDGLRNTFYKLTARAGMRGIRFHDLRHFYVSELFDLNVPEKYIIAQVGHSTSSITRSVYDHKSARKQTEISKKIADNFADLF